MQLVTRKAGPVVFEHREDFAGDVKIKRGDAELTVSFDALRTLVGEQERHLRMEELRTMKTNELLRVRKLA